MFLRNGTTFEFVRTRRCTPARGFTLLELLVTLVIVSLILAAVFGVFTRTLESKRKVEARLRRATIIDAIHRRMSEDFRSIFVTEAARSDFLGGEQQVAFVTAVDSLVPFGQKASAFSTVSYVLGQNQGQPRYFRLFRRELIRVGDEPQWRYQEVYAWVSALRFRYQRRRTVEGKWKIETLEAWDSREQQGLPDAVEVQLTVVFPPELVAASEAEPMDPSAGILHTAVFPLAAGGPWSGEVEASLPGKAVPVVPAATPMH